MIEVMTAVSNAERSAYSLASLDSDAAQVDQIYRQHGGWLVAFLRRRFGAQEAEDLAQEAYVRTVGSRTVIRNPRAFMARVALRAARELAQQKSNRLPIFQADDRDAPTLPDQMEALFLKQAVMALPQDLRTVLLLSRFAGLTYDEIAQRCGISVKRVEARMTKARARLAALIRD
jgi:RNA polymerase sigma-70 factor (ECF subfamily)